jgi:antitoxin (DNA-binding transcriptional repressor) of toxin-antitoxin stability system
VYFLFMQATLSQLHRETRRIVRPVIHAGEEVVITDFGKPVARIIPYMPTVTVSPQVARESGFLEDDSILAAIAEVREEGAEHLDP